MYEVSPSVLEARLLNSGNILDAAVVGIPNKENGQVKYIYIKDEIAISSPYGKGVDQK